MAKRQLDEKKIERIIEVARRLELQYAFVHEPGKLVAVFYLYKPDLGQYVELCRRLANIGLKVDEEFVEEPMDGPQDRRIGEIRAIVPFKAVG